ncbi:hypothetical protein LPB140_01750 [Sphingorhabdus lutea]|uniref:DUF4402 domain-containing protein n=1 Tax=Sphingorhabdus lutea TaxID=1913578 RepID=A0A1L3J9J7_9SPHN|nr:DUF4402 domain-containing protein [Sphingorhabdus lutea]APG61763.1 hypothetical protein LPB140_01750 [Sphingorhabdus lutea]
MLNKMKFAAAATILAASMGSTSAFAATQTANAQAEIISAVELSTVADLNMGVVAAGAAGGTVTLNASTGARTCSAALTCVGTATRGSFQVTNATNGYTVNLSVSASTNLTGAGAPMTLTLTPSATSIVFNSAALETVYVGGSLAVGANQTAGVYSGTYSVTANYN